MVFKALTHKQIQYFVFNKISIKNYCSFHFRDVKIQTIKKLPICGSSNEGLLAPLNNTICFSRLTEPSLLWDVLAMKGQQRWSEREPWPVHVGLPNIAKALGSCLAKLFQLFWHFMYF